jgi:hypothetical protein
MRPGDRYIKNIRDALWRKVISFERRQRSGRKMSLDSRKSPALSGRAKVQGIQKNFEGGWLAHLQIDSLEQSESRFQKSPRLFICLNLNNWNCPGLELRWSHNRSEVIGQTWLLQLMLL